MSLLEMCRCNEYECCSICLQHYQSPEIEAVPEVRKTEDSTLKHLIAISVNVKPNFKDVLLEIRFGKKDEQYSSYMQDFPNMKAALAAIQLIGEMHAQTTSNET